MTYEEEGRKAGFVEGATVKVLRKCADHELGWDNSWVAAMDSFIDGEYKIEIVDADGICFEGYGHGFPWHVCKLISPVFDPMTLKTGDRGYAWDGDRPEKVEQTTECVFAVYVGGLTAAPFKCFTGGESQDNAQSVTSWEHFEPIKEE